jgi:hypothetical protein
MIILLILAIPFLILLFLYRWIFFDNYGRRRSFRKKRTPERRVEVAVQYTDEELERQEACVVAELMASDAEARADMAKHKAFLLRR